MVFVVFISIGQRSWGFDNNRNKKHPGRVGAGSISAKLRGVSYQPHARSRPAFNRGSICSPENAMTRFLVEGITSRSKTTSAFQVGWFALVVDDPRGVADFLQRAEDRWIVAGLRMGGRAP